MKMVHTSARTPPSTRLLIVEVVCVAPHGVVKALKVTRRNLEKHNAEHNPKILLRDHAHPQSQTVFLEHRVLCCLVHPSLLFPSQAKARKPANEMSDWTIIFVGPSDDVKSRTLNPKHIPKP